MSSTSQTLDRSYLPPRGVDNDDTAFLSLDPELREIRCVILLPGSGDDPIACELVYTNINENSSARTPYIALSYCWGDIEDTVEIMLYGPSKDSSGAYQEPIIASFRITRNLHIALMALRNDSKQYLWVDALCINQQDPREKTHQVQLMGKIYSSAESVLVWLGPDDEYSRFLMRLWTEHLHPLINRLDGEALSSLYEDLFKSPHPLWDDVAQDETLIQSALNLNDARVDEVSPDRYKKALWISFNGVLGRPWWSRIWIVQEVFLAPRSEGGGRKVQFRIGDNLLHWQDTLHTKTLLPGYGPLSVSQVCHSWYSLIDMDERLVDLDIDFLLRFTSHFCASDPRDKLFALLQLASDTKERMHDPLIRPDYTKSLANVVDDLVRWKPSLSKYRCLFHVGGI
ncbi:uncharacterized protein ALTATR162_LOCUS4160 [Alternaria atra]|uniref:Heterokaryon incompatibility domain-containing protein n=1 Tax=Alternaria atra TaxID=119953 RepID=A0A8J2I277_9PLEO|nr:uncharacterized protein ALTATR162_LOCUS4160 [Alternaria atra]CAG5156362.1 unnamed protein product [Alternaria atra]